jgi:hypothetical protein
MTKSVVYALADLLRLHVQKQDKKYRMAVHVLVHVACTLFKLTHGASLFIICSKRFAVGRNTVSLILREVVCAINDTLHHELMWPAGQCTGEVQADFFNLCELPTVLGAINGTHISISKLSRLLQSLWTSYCTRGDQRHSPFYLKAKVWGSLLFLL